MSHQRKTAVPAEADLLSGRDEEQPVPDRHFVTGHLMEEPFPQHLQRAVFGLGCFWGAERRFWETRGVCTTAAGYAGGQTPNPGYQEVCSGLTGHAEVVLVVFDPKVIRFEQLLAVFWESHDPTQGMRQGNDVGTQYRSAIFTLNEHQAAVAGHSRDVYQAHLASAGLGAITTEIRPLERFYYAEEYHQQYLAKNPSGYCGLGGTGVACPISLEAGTAAAPEG